MKIQIIYTDSAEENYSEEPYGDWSVHHTISVSNLKKSNEKYGGISRKYI